MENITLYNLEVEKKLAELNGTTPFEVLSLTFFVPLCSLQIWLLSSAAARRVFLFAEIASLNSILLVALTILNRSLLQLFGILIILMFLLFCITITRKNASPELQFVINNLNTMTLPRKDFNKLFVGTYRGHLLLATAISILAVDFNVYPVRFAKTQIFGWSIMDAGVGSFVLLHGLCSLHGKMLIQRKYGLKKCIFNSLPLFILGIVRLVVTTAIGYHKVVSEYGIHWNFFFTLAITKMVCYSTLDIFPACIPYSGHLAVLFATIHQFLLSSVGLSAVVQSDLRTNILLENKEGLCSLMGFIAIYFCGVKLGHILWNESNKVKHYLTLCLTLCGIGVTGWIIMYALNETIEPVSRKMANLPYCVWVVSLTSLQLAIHLCQEIVIAIFTKPLGLVFYDSLLWKAMNYNAFFYFMFSNILTGIINVTVDTKNTSDLAALGILCLYLLTLTVSSIYCYKHSIRLKL